VHSPTGPNRRVRTHTGPMISHQCLSISLTASWQAKTAISAPQANYILYHHCYHHCYHNCRQSVYKMASFSDNSLPPKGAYLLQEALFTAINMWAITRGYAFIIRRLTIDKSGRHIITYSCNCFRHPPNASRERQRNTTTIPRGTGCQFSVLAKETWADLWILKHRTEAQPSFLNTITIRVKKHLHAQYIKLYRVLNSD
jgi:hypothetical protein